MATLKPYRLTILLSPQVKEARGAVQALVEHWATEAGATVQELRAEEQKLAYPLGQQREAVALQVRLEAPPQAVGALLGRLDREKTVLRHRAHFGAVPAGKRLKDIPLPQPEATARKREVGAPRAATAGRKPKLKRVRAKEKAPLEKLEEKIDEILKEEVL